MKRIVLPIDTKSLYFNIFNDNAQGHTCTVATPIKQGKSHDEKLEQIYKIPEQIDYDKYFDLLDELLKNSKSKNRINNVFVFNKIKVNNCLVECDKAFCIFIKEEIDPSKAQFGRIKMHYPITLKYNSLNIDNKVVLNKVSEALNHYAFIIESFDYDLEEGFLNFNALIVGYNNIPYSKVFINNKGVGNKFNQKFNNYFDVYDAEIISLRRKIDKTINPNNYLDVMNDYSNFLFELIEEYLMQKNAKQIRFVRLEYPYSLFDIRYEIDGKTFYSIIKFSFSKTKYFDLSSNEVAFLNTFSNNVSVICVSDLLNGNEISEIFANSLSTCNCDIKSIRYFVGEF